MLTWPKASMIPSCARMRLAVARSCFACARMSATCPPKDFISSAPYRATVASKRAAEQPMVERDRATAMHQEVERAGRPHRRIFKARPVPEPAVVLAVVVGGERHQHEQRQRHRPRQQAEREAGPGDELREHHGIGEQPARPVALALEHAGDAVHAGDRDAGALEVAEAHAKAVRDDPEADNDAQQRFDVGRERGVERGERGENAVSYTHLTLPTLYS